jgi:putative glutamine amidotransferase
LGLPRPLIGVTVGIERDARWRVWREPAALLPAVYLTAIARAGGRAVLLPPDDGHAEETVAGLDGLVISGGNDIDPSMYGCKPHPKTASVQPERDHGELTVLRAALRRELPVVGICRGSQLINVAHGGSLHQHLPEVIGHDGHRPGPGRFGHHSVHMLANSRLGDVLGEEASVASYHHQGIAIIGAGLKAVAWSGDGLIEAIESTDPGCFLVGVLWHPEHDHDVRLFTALVEAAKRRVRLPDDDDPGLPAGGPVAAG